MQHSAVPYIPSSKYRAQLKRHLGELTETSLCVNSDKTQITAFHLRHREAKRSLKLALNRVDVEITAHAKYFGVTFNRGVELQTAHTEYQDEGIYPKQPSFEEIIVSSKWGINTNTIRTTALALCCSNAEYVAPVWARSPHARHTGHKTEI